MTPPPPKLTQLTGIQWQRVPIVFIGHSFGGIIIKEVSHEITQRYMYCPV